MFRRPLAACALLASLAGSPGCGGASEPAPAPAPGADVSCTDDPRLDTYAGELDKAGEQGLLSFRFFDLEPAPPAKGSNTFHVQVSDVAGDIMQGELRVDLRMPDHGHGTSVEPVVSFDAASAAYTITPLFLFMPGVWRLEFEAVDAAMAIDRSVLHFCIEG